MKLFSLKKIKMYLVLIVILWTAWVTSKLAFFEPVNATPFSTGTMAVHSTYHTNSNCYWQDSNAAGATFRNYTTAGWWYANFYCADGYAMTGYYLCSNCYNFAYSGQINLQYKMYCCQITSS
jgi:hypothetical protein